MVGWLVGRGRVGVVKPYKPLWWSKCKVQFGTQREILFIKQLRIII